MLDYILSLIETISGGEPIVKSALVVIMGGAITTIIGMLLIKLPSKILKLIKSQCTVSFILTSLRWPENELLEELESEIYKRSTSLGTRNYSISTVRGVDNTRNVRFTIGEGTHVLKIAGRWLVAKLSVVDSTNPYTKLEITIMGRSRKPLDNLMEVITKNTITVPRLFAYKSREWEPVGALPKSPLESLCLNPDTRKYFVDSINHFSNNREEYYKLGLNYKSTSILYGDPGTGKTSLIRSLAYTFGYNVASLNIHDHSDKTFSEALQNIPSRTMVAIEDIDSLGSTQKRSSGAESKIDDLMLGVTLTGILNALDGIMPLDDCIIFMTTNYIDRIDEAILRPGRVDHKIELPKLEIVDLNNHLNSIYDTDEFDVKNTMKACDLSNIKNLAKFDKLKALDLANGTTRNNEIVLN